MRARNDLMGLALAVSLLVWLANGAIAEEPRSFLAPQAISAVDISQDDRVITVGTMAFRHDANVWQFTTDGAVIAKRSFPPWAPMQVATLNGGKGMAVGLAYSRVTSPEPTVWLGPTESLMNEALKEELVEADTRDSELARWRTGAGAWREGWFASQFGELFVRGSDWVFKPPTTFLKSDGQRLKLRYEDGNLLPTHRAARMVASRDGRRVAFGLVTLSQAEQGVSSTKETLSVYEVQPNRKLWTIEPSKGLPAPELPDPAADFPELNRDFRMRPDVLVPSTIVTGLAVNHNGTRIAIIEHAAWTWVRRGPVIGKWDPPIHAMNFVPRSRGRLRIFDGQGNELFQGLLETADQFEIGFGASPHHLWCWPASWFARGVKGAVWMPTDSSAKLIYRVSNDGQRMEEFAMSSAVAHAAVNPVDGRLLVSGHDGSLRFLTDDQPQRLADLNSPARVAWSSDGSFAIAGNERGRLLRIERDGSIAWDKELPSAESPVPALPPTEVVPGLPIFQGGRLPGGEHAYVGDIWIIRSPKEDNRDEAVMIDCGGTSGFATTRERLRVLGINRLTHILHTHSHGDHCGGAYLWQATGSRIVAPRSAEFTLTWMMPMMTDYGIYPPRRVDDPLPLKRVGDECEFTAAGIKFKAIFVPGHSFDLTLYLTELNGQRIAFTGDLGFDNQDILHRCWGDADKAQAVLEVIRNKLLPWKPDIVFTGHGVRKNGTEFIQNLVTHTEESLK
jgi:glyoxylase-like metal-dependent hydrolase (beta-lactamase superfamily II)